MKATFIVMSILGCDDSGASCAPVAQVEEQWQTIAACDAASELHLSRYTNVNHPMVVAVCQTANSTALADSTDDAAQMEIASRSVALLLIKRAANFPAVAMLVRGCAGRAAEPRGSETRHDGRFSKTIR